jgi:hypothetical protein
MTLSILTNGIMILCIAAFSITTHSIKTVQNDTQQCYTWIARHNGIVHIDTEHNDTLHNDTLQ